jgi:hypothetical protein
MSSDDDLVNVAVPARPAKRLRQIDGVLEFFEIIKLHSYTINVDVFKY